MKNAKRESVYERMTRELPAMTPHGIINLLEAENKELRQALLMVIQEAIERDYCFSELTRQLVAKVTKEATNER